MKKNIALILGIGLLFIFAWTCRQKTQIKGVNLSVEFSDKVLSDNLMTNVEYKWTLGEDFTKFTTEYTIYVHFWHKNNLLFQDDHVPPVPTTEWEMGKEYSYRRRIYIPVFVDEFDPEFKGEETLNMIVGLYNPYDRTGKSKKEVLSREMKVVPPPPDTPEVIYENGWNDLEIDPNAPLKQWRWTAKEARCVIDNPHRDSILIIKGGIIPELRGEQKITFRLNDIILEEFTPEETVFEKSYDIKKEVLGERDEFYLVIMTDPFFIPANIYPQSKDQRELGVAISFIYFR